MKFSPATAVGNDRNPAWKMITVKNSFIWCAIVSLMAGPMLAANPSPSVDLSQLPPPAASPVNFARDIKPILAENCHSCHGAEKQKAGLRLDLKAKALEGGDSGPAIIPRQSAESLLIHAVAGVDPDSVMPPKGERLSREQIGKLRAWIDAGAEWPDSTEGTVAVNVDHWAFKAPVRLTVPKVKNSKWVRNPIDAFVLARLQSEKIKPSPEADRPTLIRRLSLDLTGLLPTPAEVDAFVQNQRKDAYEQLVDRLLASPHFGERWGRHWLDLARYADSDGYEKDSPRPWAWLYRNWVIDAINQDLPFDQFTLEQLAGDLLPKATREQKVATGFHRQTLTNKEGGVDQEEFRCKAVVDRVSTTGTIWLGLTLGCAECHTHKYDPITQREFYELFAFFNNADETDISAPFPHELAKYESEKRAWTEKKAQFKAPLAAYLKNELAAKQAEWEASLKLPEAEWTILQPAKLEADGGITLKAQNDQFIQAAGKNAATATYTIQAATKLSGVTGFRLEVFGEFGDGEKPGQTVGRGGGNFVLSEFTVKVQPGEAGAKARTVKLQKAAATFAQKDFPPDAAIDGKSVARNGWAVGPQLNQRHVAVFETAEPLELKAGDTLIFAVEQKHGSEHLLQRFRLSATASPPPLAPSLVPDEIAALLRDSERTAQQAADLAKFYAEIDPGLIALKTPLERHLKSVPALPATKAMTLAERTESRRATHMHVRGDFLRKGSEVQPATLAVLHPLQPRGETPDRIDLAHWLMDPANPLTGRVVVNHVWGNLFGRGLVATMDDFGTRGDPPTHPELLDWLATEFPRLGWSRKALIKLIVLSNTYRQSSVIRPELLERDASNTLLARQNRFRLEAENVRDIHLAASGLLSREIGGPSIRPPLPADIAALGYANSVKWQESSGQDKYRRGMYIFFQRTVPYPMLATFDAPDSNATCSRRERSNTPLQALTLLNDPVFFECAQALGRRLVEENCGTIEERLQRAFKVCLSREPTGAELARLRQLYQDQKRLIEAEPDRAPQLAGTSKDAAAALDLAALVGVGRIIMNLDEFITRE